MSEGAGSLSGRQVWCALGVVAVCTLAATSALAWRQYETTGGQAMRWTAQDLAAGVTWTAAVEGTGLDIDVPSLVLTAQAAFGRWSAVECPAGCASSAGGGCPGPGCQSPTLPLAVSFAGVAPPRRPGTNCAGGESCATGDRNQVVVFTSAIAWPFGASVVALTVLTAESATGRLVDADVGLNSADFVFFVGEGPAAPLQTHAHPLFNVLLHEAGHFIGLDHSDAPAALMQAAATTTDDPPGSLGPDDIAGVCAVYGGGQAAGPNACPQSARASSGWGCDVGLAAPMGGPRGWFALVGVACLAAIRLGRRPAKAASRRQSAGR